MAGLKTLARILLLVGGLGHVLPGTLSPILKIGAGPLTLQLVVGVLSVIIAVYLIIKKVP